MVSNTIIASSWVPGTSGQIELAVKLRPQLQKKKNNVLCYLSKMLFTLVIYFYAEIVRGTDKYDFSIVYCVLSDRASPQYKAPQLEMTTCVYLDITRQQLPTLP